MQKQNMTFKEAYETFFPHNDHERGAKDRGAKGVLEFIIKDKKGNIVHRHFEPNIVKIFAKEMLAHQLPSSEIWDQQANGGVGAWVASDIDPTEEFSARYILLGASFDANGLPLDTDDSRFYSIDTITGQIVPVRLGPGAEFSGSLINAIPFSEPGRPLKKVEQISFNATFQPSGTPILQDDVRGMNNIVELQTTIRLDEYNGFGLTDSDFFTITEVALAGGRKIDLVGACECTPRELFLEGQVTGSSGTSPVETIAVPAIANSSDVISIDPSFTDVDIIKEGDQIKIVGRDDKVTEQSINQITPFYLVLTKLAGGRDIQLDRTPVDINNNPLSGDIGFFRDTLRIFSHRVLSVPIKKSSDFEIQILWRIIFS